jgi:hypothetical protein
VFAVTRFWRRLSCVQWSRPVSYSEDCVAYMPRWQIMFDAGQVRPHSASGPRLVST